MIWFERGGIYKSNFVDSNSAQKPNGNVYRRGWTEINLRLEDLRLIGKDTKSGMIRMVNI